MMKETDKIDSVELEVSIDSKNYEKHKEVRVTGQGSIPITNKSTKDILAGLIEEGKDICKKGNYKTFRLKITMEKEHFFLYAGAESKKSKAEINEEPVPKAEQLRYETLTEREQEILCFIYRGYEPEAIATVFQMGLHTLKEQCARIYEKTGFRDEEELTEWCDNYLHKMFNQKDGGKK